MIFAREVSDPLTSLVKKIDAATAQNKSKRMGSFVVFLGEDDTLPQQLKQMASKEQLQHTVLTVSDKVGPRGYQVARDADVTVVLYKNKTVKVNHAFKKGELKNADVDKIVADLEKILQ